MGSRRALLEWTRRELARLGVRPRRKLGQNFIVEPRFVRLHARLVSGCREVFEVGGGLGTLTALLSDYAMHVTSVELDRRLVPALAEVAREHHNITVVEGDALEVWGRFECVAGNMPYAITGPFLSRLALELRPRLAVLTVQREVADRLLARPGSGEYGRITVLIQLVFNVEGLDVIPPSAFYPQPEVYSRLVVMRVRGDAPGGEELRLVESLTRCLFSERNKRASKVFKRCCGREPPGFIGERRVYELSPSEILELARVCGVVQS